MTEQTQRETGIARALLLWLRDCPALEGLPVHYGHLPPQGGAMLTPEPDGVRVRHYIGGGRAAEYPFRLALRAFPAGDEERLRAEETLRSAAAWMEAQAGAAPEGCGITGIRIGDGAAVHAGEGGAQDRALRLIVQVEVM